MSVKMHRLKAVIFDMDGLMLDTERLAIPSLRRAGEAIGIHLTDDMLIEMNGLNEKEANRLLATRLGFPIPEKEFSAAFYEDYDRVIAENGIPLKDGLIELIDFLEAHHIRRAVATSTNIELALKKLTMVGIIDRFEVVIGGDQVAKGKPAPDPYLKAADSLDIHVDHCLALEDSDNGAMSAATAGMRVIIVPDMKPPSEATKRVATGIYSSLFEVMDYISQNLAGAKS
jgi:HAD superfamily hydrolase (TIGR01509 family)